MHRQRKPRSAQIIITTSFLTVLVMLTIAFVAYSAAIFNTEPFFEDYASIAQNFRASSDALTRHILANITAYAKSQGNKLTLTLLDNYINSKIVPLLNLYASQFANSAPGKALSIKITPAANYALPSTTLFNGSALSWPGFSPSGVSNGGIAYSLSSFRYYLNITSVSLTGYTFTSTALLMINATKTTYNQASGTIQVQLLGFNEGDFELNLNLLTASVYSSSTGWKDYAFNSTLFSFVNGNYTLTINAPPTATYTQISFSVFDPRSVVVFMNSTI
jgi:hypothetical protein